MTFRMLDSATEPTPAAVAAAKDAGYAAWAGYGAPSAGWSEAHAWSDAGFAAVRDGGLVPVLIHFGPDAQQAIAQAQRLGITRIAVDKEYNDYNSYVAFGKAVQAAGLLAIEYGTVRGVTDDASGFQSYWLAEPGWSGTPGDRYAVQYTQAVVGGITCDVSLCGDNFLTLPAHTPVTEVDIVPQPGQIWCQGDPLTWPQGDSGLFYRTRAASASPLGRDEFENEIEQILAVPQGTLRAVGWFMLDGVRTFIRDNPFPPPGSDVYVGSAKLGVGH